MTVLSLVCVMLSCLHCINWSYYPFTGQSDKCSLHSTTTTTTAPATSHVTVTPVTTTPGYVTTTPGYVTTTPGHVTMTPSHVTTTPGHVTTTPGHVTTTPGHATTTPGHATTTSGHATMTPGHATTTTLTHSPGIVIIGGDECLITGIGMLYYIIFLYCLPCVYYRL